MGMPALYPKVARILSPFGATQGAFPAKVPEGVTVHFAADRDLARVVKSLRQNNLAYHLLIDRAGGVHQMAPFTHRVAHAGPAMWNGKSPNQKHAAVSLLSWGPLTRDAQGDAVSWAHQVVPPVDVVSRYGNLDKKLHLWDKASREQEDALAEVLRWFMAFGIKPEDICGHDECALPKGRKDDPGGVLPMTMPELRRALARPMVS